MVNLQQVTEIKCVKNSTVVTDGRYVKVFHYGTVILLLDLLEGKVIDEYKASKTSTKMINRVKIHYGIPSLR